MKHYKLLVAAVASGLAAGSAHASLCAMDQKPAATLLVPYFEVDITACGTPTSQRTTTFWVRNTDDQPQLAQVTLWSNGGLATFGFQVYLPPLSAQRVNLADVLCQGRLPSTGRAVSPNSPFDADSTNENFPACNAGSDPADGTPVADQLDAAFLFELQARLTGRRSPQFGNACFGVAVEGGPAAGDPVARGYITIDDVSRCGTDLPSDPIYHQTVIDFDNVYVGGYQVFDPANNFAFGGAAVAVESAPGIPAPSPFPFGQITFYGRYQSPQGNGVDRREPLPAAWAATYRQGGVLADNTDMIVWRDQPRRASPSSGMCARNPNPAFSQGQDQRLFDGDGESSPPPVVFPGQPVPQNQPFIATQRIPQDEIETTASLSTGTIGGLAYINMSVFDGFPSIAGTAGQAWMGSVQISEGRYSDIASGVSIGSSCVVGAVTPADVAGPTARSLNTRNFLFIDGFED